MQAWGIDPLVKALFRARLPKVRCLLKVDFPFYKCYPDILGEGFFLINVILIDFDYLRGQHTHTGCGGMFAALDVQHEVRHIQGA